MSNQKITTNSAKETKEIGVALVKQILQQKVSKTAIILSLQGDLGAGKTTFLQGFAKGLGIEEKVLSPTFVILKKFKITEIKNQKSKIKNTNQKLKNLYHVDCYRLKNEKDLEVLGFKEIISNPQNIVAIEWPEKIEKILPKEIILIKFQHYAENHRTLTIRE
ncbi:MAG: tRNA (adenosine(37)-N6)-threonylcarbamoyltransferase complex ATPase subunit type 1 TsaE [Patescibacteria group bacterium]